MSSGGGTIQGHRWKPLQPKVEASKTRLQEHLGVLAYEKLGGNPPYRRCCEKLDWKVIFVYIYIPQVWCFRCVFWGSKYRTSGGVWMSFWVGLSCVIQFYSRLLKFDTNEILEVQF